jgi:hypothetical protein
MEEDYRNTFDRQQDRLNEESKERVSRGEEKRASRKAQKDVRKAERLQLGAATSAFERRDIKERFEKIEQGVESGGIYDVSTDSYQPPEGNEAGANTNMSETGVQEVTRNADTFTLDVVQVATNSDDQIVNVAGTATFNGPG